MAPPFLGPKRTRLSGTICRTVNGLTELPLNSLQILEVAHLRPQRTSQGSITLEELQQALARMKAHKAPGPDEAPAELFKWLDANGEHELLAISASLGKRGPYRAIGSMPW